MSNQLRKTVVLGIFFVAIVSTASAALLARRVAGTTIIGSVVDSALTPLAGVVVSLERAGRVETKSTTDADGRFRFTSIAAGDYIVRAEQRDFTPFSRALTVRAGVDSMQLPIVLARAGERLEQNDKATKAPAPTAAPVTAPTTTAAGANASGGRGGGGGGRGGAAQGQAQGSITLSGISRGDGSTYSYAPAYPPPPGETYTFINPNRFQSTTEHPLSTFGADVDTASYSNIRRFLSSGQLPPREAVRVEEMLNYFTYAYPNPSGPQPIALTSEIGECPWAPTHNLVLIGARAKAPVEREITGRNIVLLIDVSGSMAPVERLPLIKAGLRMFVDTLRPDDTLSIVTYAGTSGIALYPTQARQRDVIQRAIAGLAAGGSTNGGEGLKLAYRMARQGFISGGVNRVILATDGDFNVGIVSEQDLLQLIERERDSGVFLSVFGVGSGNLKDRTMEMLADHGNGHYAYLDSIQEARRVLIREGDATLETVAKDVKFQVEFNPAAVAAWKLIGYEDRALAARDFNDDRKDAGEMGAGHTVTVLYEVIPVGNDVAERDDSYVRPEIDPLRYQSAPVAGQTFGSADPVIDRVPPVVRPKSDIEWLQVKARYKQPEGETSQLITQIVRPGGRVQYLPFVSAVAEFGLLLRDQPHNAARWNALVLRLDTLPPPPGTSASDRDAFRELVAIAAGLAR